MTIDKLDLIKTMIENAIKTQDMLVSSQRFLEEILELCKEESPKAKKEKKKKTKANSIPEDTKTDNSSCVVVSCDASIKNNPGGPSSAGVVIRIPGRDPIRLAKITPGNTNNEAEYDAVYEGLSHLAHMQNGLQYEIVVHSDSQLVVNQLTGKFKIGETQKALARRATVINELAKEMSVPVRIEWRPRNSTKDLQDANYLAQDLLNVPRH